MIKFDENDKRLQQLLEYDYEPLYDITELMESYQLPHPDLELCMEMPYAYNQAATRSIIIYNVTYKTVILSQVLSANCDFPGGYPIIVGNMRANFQKIGNPEELQDYFEKHLDHIMTNLLNTKFISNVTTQNFIDAYDYIETLSQQKANWKYKETYGFYYYPKKHPLICELMFVKKYPSRVRAKLVNGATVGVYITKDIQKRLKAACTK